MSKHCNKCNRDLPLSEFHKDKTNNDGLNRWCIACKRVSRFKNCEIPEVYLKRRWDAFGQINKNRKTQRAKKDITYEELLELFNNFCNENIKQGKHQYSCRYTGDVMTFFKEGVRWEVTYLLIELIIIKHTVKIILLFVLKILIIKKDN
jgi:hypothetical protein